VADIGIWMSAAVLQHKLEARSERNPEQAWNLARWPAALSQPGEHRLFVAGAGRWRGYFLLSSDALYNPSDTRTPFTLLFDTRTWTPIAQLPARRFRGFTYDVPPLSSPLHTPPTKRARTPSPASGDHRH
jgi:hypothetical protein